MTRNETTPPLNRPCQDIGVAPSKEKGTAVITQHNISHSEEWRTVASFPDYLVSDQGRVASRKGAVAKLLRPFLNGRPGQEYPSVTIRQGGHRQIRTVHSLVAEAFIGPRPDGLEIRHLNGDRMDARPLNLRYGTKAENMQDRVAHGNHPMANKTHCLRGHEFTEENTRVYRGSRFCKACKRHRETVAAFRAAGIEVAA